MKHAMGPWILIAVVAVGCRGKDSSVKVTKTQFNPGLGSVPGDLPDKPPAEKIGEAYTVYGLWLVTQDPERQKAVQDSEITVKGYVVNVTQPAADRTKQNVTPHVWIADQNSRLGLWFPLTGYTDNYDHLQDAADYDLCIETCAKTRGDPRSEADATPGRYSRIFGGCVTDVPECRALYETKAKARYYEATGAILRWYVRDQIFGSAKRKAVEDELRGQGNLICEAGPLQRRVMVTTMVAVELGVDLAAYEKAVRDEIREKYPRESIDRIDPQIIKQISDKHLAMLDDPQNGKKVVDLVRAIRAGTNDGSALLDDRKWGPELRSALAKSEGEPDIKKVADDLLADLLIRYFWSRADARPEANLACVFDDLVDLTSSYNLEPIDLLTRIRVMLGPLPGTTWQQAMASGQAHEIRAKFVSLSRTGFLGWTLDITPSMICEVKANCPEWVNPLFGTVYEFGFAEVARSGGP
jgi:hypothetical protein